MIYKSIIYQITKKLQVFLKRSGSLYIRQPIRTTKSKIVKETIDGLLHLKQFLKAANIEINLYKNSCWGKEYYPKEYIEQYEKLSDKLFNCDQQIIDNAISLIECMKSQEQLYREN